MIIIMKRISVYAQTLAEVCEAKTRLFDALFFQMVIRGSICLLEEAHRTGTVFSQGRVMATVLHHGHY